MNPAIINDLFKCCPYCDSESTGEKWTYTCGTHFDENGKAYRTDKCKLQEEIVNQGWTNYMNKIYRNFVHVMKNWRKQP